MLHFDQTGSSENPVIDVTDTLYHRPCGAWNETDASVDETSGNCTALIDVEASTPDTLTQIEDFIEYYSTHGFMSQVPLRHVSVYRFPGPGEMQHNSTNLVAFVDAPSTSANELEVATSMLSMLASSGAVDGLLQRSGYGTADIATAVVCEHCDKQAMYAVTGALEAFLMFSSSLDIDEALQTAIYSAIESFVDQFISAEYITGIEVTVTVKLAGSSGAERRMLATDKEYTVAIEVKTEGAGLVGLRRMQLGIQEDWDPKIADELRKALEEVRPLLQFLLCLFLLFTLAFLPTPRPILMKSLAVSWSAPLAPPATLTAALMAAVMVAAMVAVMAPIPILGLMASMMTLTCPAEPLLALPLAPLQLLQSLQWLSFVRKRRSAPSPTMAPLQAPKRRLSRQVPYNAST